MTIISKPLHLCLLCGGEPGPPLIQEGSHFLRRCSVCDLLFVSPRPPPEQISAIYEHDSAHTASRQQQAKARDPSAHQHALHTLSLLPPRLHGKPLLELGPGGGSFLRVARELGYPVMGLEPNPVQVEFLGQLGLPCILGGIEKLPEKQQFSILYHGNVLSHLPDPVETFRQLRNAVTDDGIMLFETGNYGEISPRYFPLIQRTESFQLPDHLCFFGEKSMQFLLSQSGWVLEGLHRYSRLLEKWLPSIAKPLGFSRWVRNNRHGIKYGSWASRLGMWTPTAPQSWIVLARPG